MPPKLWNVIATETDKSYRVFNLRTDRAVSPRTGNDHDFFILESSPWVNVIPITPQNQVILVRQYRHGIRALTLEIPGGLVESQDTPERAAVRELYEETGYRAEKVISLGSTYPNPAIQNNLCHSFLAKNAFHAGPQNQDDKEDIEVVKYPLDDIPGLIRSGEINHGLVLVAFYRFYMEYQPCIHQKQTRVTNISDSQKCHT